MNGKSRYLYEKNEDDNWKEEEEYQ
jgi:hypothetical protein